MAPPPVTEFQAGKLRLVAHGCCEVHAGDYVSEALDKLLARGQQVMVSDADGTAMSDVVVRRKLSNRQLELDGFLFLLPFPIASESTEKDFGVLRGIGENLPLASTQTHVHIHLSTHLHAPPPPPSDGGSVRRHILNMLCVYGHNSTWTSKNALFACALSRVVCAQPSSQVHPRRLLFS